MDEPVFRLENGQAIYPQGTPQLVHYVVWCAGPCKPAEVALHLQRMFNRNVARAYVAKVLASLVDRKKLLKVGHGVYRANPEHAHGGDSLYYRTHVNSRAPRR